MSSWQCTQPVQTVRRCCSILRSSSSPAHSDVRLFERSATRCCAAQEALFARCGNEKVSVMGEHNEELCRDSDGPADGVHALQPRAATRASKNGVVAPQSIQLKVVISYRRDQLE